MLSRLVLLVACSALAALPAAASATCESLAKINLPNTTIAVAQTQTAGSFTPPEQNAKPMTTLPEFCRVSGVIKPSSDSNIKFEVWMPTSSSWNGRYEGLGNGGFAGSVSWDPMAAAVTSGYAASSTDTGHEGSAITATWALDHPQKITDFGYRAIHETAENAKKLIKAYYGNDPKHSYFSSCSNGGRQALMEAQRYPADYDGIIAGAPALTFTHIATDFLWNLQATDGPNYIPTKKWAAIENAALASCDALDGVKDGVIDDPSQCHFDPAKMLCSGAETDACLTQAQIDALKKIYSGPINSKGERIIAGFEPGGESGMAGWGLWISGSTPNKSLEYAFGTQFYANMVYDKADWDYHTFQVDRDTKAGDEKQAKNLNATDTDLKKFKDHGGKLILYHGWSDAALPPVNTIEYYKAVEAKMGAKNADAFVRLFMVPGMQHCGGGPGPSVFGQGGAAQGDAQHDMARALEHWVEDGVAPTQIIATKYKNPMNPKSEVVRTRPLCAYPQVARWNGAGSTDDAANFVCGTHEGTK
jgi:hypothetical protein